MFSFPQRCFIGPGRTEVVRVTFSPLYSGSYEAVLSVLTILVVRREQAGSSPTSPHSSLILKALAEKPQLKVISSQDSRPLLDYGVLMGGASLSLPLQLANLGCSDLPLRLTVAAVSCSILSLACSSYCPSLPTIVLCRAPCLSFISRLRRSLPPSSPPLHPRTPNPTLPQ